jgi:hypothetical protein
LPEEISRRIEIIDGTVKECCTTPTCSGEAVLRPEHCVLVVEVMSPGSITAEYASAGIGHFWRIEDVDDTKRTLTVFRYRLDPTTHGYVPAGIDTGTLVVREPVSVVIELADLY